MCIGHKGSLAARAGARTSGDGFMTILSQTQKITLSASVLIKTSEIEIRRRKNPFSLFRHSDRKMYQNICSIVAVKQKRVLFVCLCCFSELPEVDFG